MGEESDEPIEKKSSAPSSPDPGVFVTKGMSIGLSEFSITILPDGQIQASPVYISTELNMSPYWLEIAFQHLLDTQAASNDLCEAKLANAPEAIAASLQQEFVAGMQAIMASAVAIDAYYACIKERAGIPAELSISWQKNKTARYKQIAEVLRRTFPMSEEAGKILRKHLGELQRFRDKSVHPPSGTTPPELHPELNKATDWRFVAFRFHNAKAATAFALSVVSQTSSRCPQDASEALRTYCATVSERVQMLVQLWEERFGNLIE